MLRREIKHRVSAWLSVGFAAVAGRGILQKGCVRSGHNALWANEVEDDRDLEGGLVPGKETFFSKLVIGVIRMRKRVRMWWNKLRGSAPDLVSAADGRGCEEYGVGAVACAG